MWKDEQVKTRPTPEEQERLLQAVRDAVEAKKVATRARATAIGAADDAGVPRDLIAEAANLSWPVRYQRWSQLRKGKNR